LEKVADNIIFLSTIVNFEEKNMKTGIIWFFLAALVTSTISYADNTKKINTQNGHAYQLIQTKTTWTDAKSYCENLGGYLVTVTSREEQIFIFNHFLKNSNHDVWAGATDQDAEGDWKWTTGEPFNRTNWRRGEPNNEMGVEDYLELRSVFGFKWNDVPNAVKKNRFICEWDKQPNALPAETSDNALNEKSREPSDSSYGEKIEASMVPEDVGEKDNAFSDQPFIYYLPLFTYSNKYLTGVGISNSSASREANVLINVFGNNGQIILTDTMRISPDGQQTKVLYTETNRQGWSKIVSDQPLTGVCFMVAAGAGSDNFMADVAFSPKTYTRLHVPHVSSDDSWDTHLFIANPNDVEETVYIDVVASDGILTASSSKKIVAMGSDDFSLSSVLQGKTLVGGKVKMTASTGFVAFALYTNIKTGARSFAGISPMEPVSSPGK
jgi:hypothetical protein